MTPSNRFPAIGWNIKAIAALLVVFFVWLYLPLGVIGFIGFLYVCLLLQTPKRQLPAAHESDSQSDVILLMNVTHLDCDDDHIIVDIQSHLTASQIIFAPTSGVIEDKLWIDGAYISADTPHFELLSARQELLISLSDDEQLSLVQYASPQTRYLTSALITGPKITSR